MEVTFTCPPLSLTCASSHSWGTRTIPSRSSNPLRNFLPRASLGTSFVAPFVGGSVSGDITGQKLGVPSLWPSPLGRRGKRGVVTMIMPFLRGNAWEQPPPDIASYLYKNRIVYLGMSLVLSVTELILSEFLYLQHVDADKPIYLYINSTGTTKRKVGL